MKIKVKKTMTHGEFAKYIVDKFGITSFERNLAGAECFGVPSDVYIASINLNPAKFDDFAHSIRIDEDGVKIETYEEITEDTRLDKLVVRYRNDDIYIFPQERINDFKNDSSIVAFYIPNDDLTLTLIWTREKGLVE